MLKDIFSYFFSSIILVIFHRCVTVFVRNAILGSLMSVCLYVPRWPALLGYCPFWQPAMFLYVRLFVKLNLANKVWLIDMTSSAKPEVHNLTHCRQTGTKPRPRVTLPENLVKFCYF